MDCATFSKKFQENMNALGLPAPNSLFSSLTAALGNLTAILGAFDSVGPTATVEEILKATTLREKLSVGGLMAASYYIGAVIGSVLVAAQAAEACKDPYRNNLSVQRYRAFWIWLASRGVMIPIDFQIFVQNHPEVIIDSPHRRSYAMRARQHGAKQ